MKNHIKTHLKRLPYLLLVLFCLLTVSVQAASSKQKADSVSTADVQFKPLTADTTSMPAKHVVQASIRNHSAAKIAGVTTPVKKSLSLWTIFIAGFIGGLAALLLPCIFPMLPLTVGFFTKRHSNPKKGILDAAIYGLSIILIYVGLGMLITVIFGADALNALSTNGIFNFVFFLLLVVFAASFFGAFEITLPNKWANKAEENTERKGFAGIFFMAAALALVSFSCTGPIIGTLLVQAATSGARLGPAVGMLGFSIALSFPFVLFALFPSWLNNLPKSGGWLNSVKVFLGFLELGLSLKFLSNVDLTYHWHLFDREVFLVLWIVIAALTGFYLLGKLKFGHDSDVAYISVPRLFLAIIVLSFSVYMVPGLWGAPLKSIAAFLPPQASQDFDLYTPTLSGGNSNAVSTITSNEAPHKYANLFDKPLNLNPFFDYKEGVAYAQKVHKPVIIDFTGHACVNCRKMEATVWPDKKVLPLLKDSYVLIQLYVDDKTELPANEQYVSSFSHRKVTNIGALNSDIQATRFNTNSQPYYVLLNPVTETTLVTPEGADYDPAAYYTYLQSGLNLFK
ncbi:protein-disulfide reductase DsbD family protein [Mucilaginibacter gotjawali]|uniref:Thiol:disulfide interchange protein DsbD n=1 Tax=Mucilaginibacter gotjawali TaxID=1550579 RepID=A0A839S9M4_9SPHI|nr:cytochrome c biogenesis protein CcdA [Mucilaginibacter gotjawali]MBB3054328.1 thiol:disulfide interchange protein DsbD [Mucilaginibacter gotjawali]